MSSRAKYSLHEKSKLSNIDSEYFPIRQEKHFDKPLKLDDLSLQLSKPVRMTEGGKRDSSYDKAAIIDESDRLQQLNSYNEQVEHLKAQVDFLEEQLGSIGNVERKKSLVKSNMRPSESRIGSTQDETGLAHSIQMTSRKGKSLKKVHSNKQSMHLMNEMQSSIRKIETQLQSNSQQSQQKLKQRNQKLLQEKKVLQEAVQDLTSQLSSYESELHGSQQMCKELQRETEELGKELELYDRQNQELIKKNNQLKKEQEMIPELKQQLAELKEAMSRLELEESDQQNREKEVFFSGQQRQMELTAKYNDLLVENAKLKEDFNRMYDARVEVEKQVQFGCEQLRQFQDQFIMAIRRLKGGQKSEWKVEQGSGLNDAIISLKFILEEYEQCTDQLRISSSQAQGDQSLLEQKLKTSQELINELKKKCAQLEEQALFHQGELRTKVEEVRALQQSNYYSECSRLDNDRLKLQVTNQLLNIRHQIEQLRGMKSRSNEESYESLLDFLSENTQEMALKERELLEKVKALETQKENMGKELVEKLGKIEDLKAQFEHERGHQGREIEVRERTVHEMELKVQFLEEEVAKLHKKCSEDQEFSQSQRLLMDKEFTNMDRRSQNMRFVKGYLEKKVKYLQAQLEDYDEKLRKCINLDSQKNPQVQPCSPIEKFRRVSIAVIAARRLINSSKTCANLKFKKLKIEYAKKERPYLIEKTRQFINAVLNENNKLDWKLTDLTQANQEKEEAIGSLQQEVEMKIEEINYLQSKFRASQEENQQQLVTEKLLLTRQVGELQEELNEKEELYQQKIKYIKRDIELKNLQIGSVQNLVKKKDLEIQSLTQALEKVKENLKQSPVPQVKIREQGIFNQAYKNGTNYSFADA